LEYLRNDLQHLPLQTTTTDHKSEDLSPSASQTNSTTVSVRQNLIYSQATTTAKPPPSSSTDAMQQTMTMAIAHSADKTGAAKTR